VRAANTPIKTNRAQHTVVTNYKLTLHPTANRELQALQDHQRDRLTETLQAVAEHRSPTQHEKSKQLEGQRGVFRVRVGDVRAVLSLQKPELRVLKVGTRGSVYDGIDDEIESRRASA